MHLSRYRFYYYHTALVYNVLGMGKLCAFCQILGVRCKIIVLQYVAIIQYYTFAIHENFMHKTAKFLIPQKLTPLNF